MPVFILFYEYRMQNREIKILWTFQEDCWKNK